jgi:hypothetical protein
MISNILKMASVLEFRSSLYDIPEGVSILRSWDAQEKSLDSIKESLYEIYDSYHAELNNVRRENNLGRLVSRFYAITAQPGNVSYMQNVLSKRYKEALASYAEFEEYPLFRKALDKFFLTPAPRMFSVVLDDYGNVIVKIRAEEEAGSPEELGNAVTLAREYMKQWAQENATSERAKKMGGSTLDGPAATLIWYIKLYRTARKGKIYWSWRKNKKSGEKTKVYYHELTAYYRQFYKEYMRARLEEMNGQAPIWYLLENGNLEAHLSSDKGGKGDPAWPATHFIASSELELQQWLQGVANEEANQIRVDNVFADPTAAERHYQSIMNRIDYTIKLVNELIEDEEEGKDIKDLDQETNFVLDKVEDMVEDVNDSELFIDKSKAKLVLVAEEIVYGTIPENKRIYIVGKGGKEVRITAKKYLQQLESDPEGQKILQNLREIPVDVRQARLAASQVRVANLRHEERKQQAERQRKR